MGNTITQAMKENITDPLTAIRYGHPFSQKEFL
jgi:hypothetical protein